MRYVTNVALSIHGSRVEKQTEIELTDEQAANFGPADLSPVDKASTGEEPAPADVAVEDMTADQLKAKAKELGLASTGTKAAILERIQLHLEGKEEPAPAETKPEEQA